MNFSEIYGEKITAQAEELAKSMGVSVDDTLSLLNMVATSIQRDGAIDAYLNATEDQQDDICSVYVQHEVNKYSDFCIDVLSNPNKRQVFADYVFCQF